MPSGGCCITPLTNLPVDEDVDEPLAVERQRDGAAQFMVVER